MRRAGLSRLSDLRPQEPVQRYEREHPGELLHIGIKKLGRFDKVGHRITDKQRAEFTPRGAIQAMFSRKACCDAFGNRATPLRSRPLAPLRVRGRPKKFPYVDPHPAFEGVEAGASAALEETWCRHGVDGRLPEFFTQEGDAANTVRNRNSL